ncbi:MAG: NAD(P)-binding domain-containing protein [Candidatus Glassbacteria bacterium]
MSSVLGNLFYKGPDVEILKAPAIDENFESNVKGVHIIGDLSGVPLLKNAVNMGHDLITKIGPQLKSEDIGDGEYHLVIVGAGGAGLAAALAAKEMGLRYFVIEQKVPGNTIHSFFKGKEIFAEPEALPNRSRLWVEQSVKEELLEHWEETIREENLDLARCEQVTGIMREGSSFNITTTKETYRAHRVILAMGRSGTPRMLRIPGEELSNVHYVLTDPDEYTMKKIVIVGGGDTSLEAALALAPHNDVTLIIRAARISRAQKKNIDRLNSMIETGRVELLTETKPVEIREGELDVDLKGSKKTLPMDHLFVMIGSVPPYSFLKKLGVRMVGDWSLSRFLYLLGFSALVFFLYGWKKPLFWPFTDVGWLYSWTSWQPSMWFGLLYSVVITGFGTKAIIKYRKDPYQVKRYTFLILSQVLLFWIIPEIIFQMILKLPDGWRSYGLFYPAPLYVWNFWDPKSAHVFWFAWSVLITLAGIPIMAKYTAKKYCAYVCSCGGLAETLGDSFRTLSPRGLRARAWESLLTYTVTVTVALVIIFGLMDRDSNWWNLQRILIDFVLAGFVGIASYPFWGNRIWCRFFCPLAKLLYIFAKDNSDIKISSGQHCIRCTLCSKYCQMGIQVMEFAKQGEEFSNKNSCCIQCGICVTVCPTRNLQHGDWSEKRWEKEIKEGPPIHVI